jgi:hypothetical protein
MFLRIQGHTLKISEVEGWSVNYVEENRNDCFFYIYMSSGNSLKIQCVNNGGFFNNKTSMDIIKRAFIQLIRKHATGKLTDTINYVEEHGTIDDMSILH